MPHFSCQGGEQELGCCCLTSLCVPEGAGAALEALPREQQREEATATTMAVTLLRAPQAAPGDGPVLAGFSQAFPPDFSLPLKR